MDALADVRALFDPAPDSIYLDAATYGLPPRPTTELMHAALQQWQAGTADWIPEWDERGELCRRYFSELIGASLSEIALMPSASVGVGTVATSLQSNDEVLVADDEFTSLLFPLLVKQRERGVRVRSVPFDALSSNVTPETTLVAFSLVQSHSGRVAALQDILSAAQRVGARTLIDATHGVPFVPLHEAIEHVDYLVCAAYKHLLSPRGVAF